MPRIEPPPYVDPEATELSEKLKAKFGDSPRVIAEALNIPRRTYIDWLRRGLNTSKKWHRAKLVLRNGLKKSE